MVNERGGEGALPHLGVGDANGDVALGVDANQAFLSAPWRNAVRARART